MLIGIIAGFSLIFLYALLYSAAQGRDRTLEDQAQMEYLKAYMKQKRQQK